MVSLKCVTQLFVCLGFDLCMYVYECGLYPLRATPGALWLARGMMSASCMGSSVGGRAAVALENPVFTLKW